MFTEFTEKETSTLSMFYLGPLFSNQALHGGVTVALTPSLKSSRLESWLGWPLLGRSAALLRCGLVLGLPKAAARLEETTTGLQLPWLSFSSAGRGVSATAKGICENSACRVQAVLAGPHMCVWPTHTDTDFMFRKQDRV